MALHMSVFIFFEALHLDINSIFWKQKYYLTR